jgi:hypothetical protein
MAASWYLRPRRCFHFDHSNKQRCLEEAPNSSWHTGHGYTAHRTGLPFDGAFNSTPLGVRGALGDPARLLAGSRGLACTIINQAGPRVSLLQPPSFVTRAPPRWSLFNHCLRVLLLSCGPPVTCSTEAPSHLAHWLYEDDEDFWILAFNRRTEHLAPSYLFGVTSISHLVSSRLFCHSLGTTGHHHRHCLKSPTASSGPCLSRRTSPLGTTPLGTCSTPLSASRPLPVSSSSRPPCRPGVRLSVNPRVLDHILYVGRASS